MTDRIREVAPLPLQRFADPSRRLRFCFADERAHRRVWRTANQYVDVIGQYTLRKND
jgi:hypothetical protein